MTDREIDALVAERVMGWTNMWRAESGQVFGSDPEADCRHECKAHSPENYSTDIAAAWQVVEKIVGDQYSWKFELKFISGRPAPGRIWATFTRWKDGEQFEGWSNEAPKAICLAALKSLGAGEKA